VTGILQIEQVLEVSCHPLPVRRNVPEEVGRLAVVLASGASAHDRPTDRVGRGDASEHRQCGGDTRCGIDALAHDELGYLTEFLGLYEPGARLRRAEWFRSS
jgi:hypothetical protein